ncbi:MAG: hypothetical protein ACPGUV_12395 [Polyangiales bacterium]
MSDGAGRADLPVGPGCVPSEASKLKSLSTTRSVAVAIAPVGDGAALVHSIDHANIAFQRLDATGQRTGSVRRLVMRHARRILDFRPMGRDLLLLTVGVDAQSKYHTKAIIARVLSADGAPKGEAAAMVSHNWPDAVTLKVHDKGFAMLKAGVYEGQKAIVATRRGQSFETRTQDVFCAPKVERVTGKLTTLLAMDGRKAYVLVHVDAKIAKACRRQAKGRVAQGWYLQSVDAAGQTPPRLAVPRGVKVFNVHMDRGRPTLLVRRDGRFHVLRFDADGKLRQSTTPAAGSTHPPPPFDIGSYVYLRTRNDEDDSQTLSVERKDAAFRRLGPVVPVASQRDGDADLTRVAASFWIVYGTRQGKQHDLWLRRLRCGAARLSPASVADAKHVPEIGWALHDSEP